MNHQSNRHVFPHITWCAFMENIYKQSVNYAVQPRVSLVRVCGLPHLQDK